MLSGTARPYCGYAANLIKRDRVASLYCLLSVKYMGLVLIHTLLMACRLPGKNSTIPHVLPSSILLFLLTSATSSSNGHFCHKSPAKIFHTKSLGIHFFFAK